MKLFQELINEVNLPMEFTIGLASETLGFDTGGSSGDWINTNFKILASEVEIGSWEELLQAIGCLPQMKFLLNQLKKVGTGLIIHSRRFEISFHSRQQDIKKHLFLNI